MARKKQFAALALMGSMVLSSSGVLSVPAVFADSFAKDNVQKEEEKIDSATPDVDPNATIAIDSTNFPDAKFREYVKKFDTNNNGSLTDAERSAVKTINVNELGISKLKGIEYFTGITTLKCAGNTLSSYYFDISKNTALQVLDISRNEDLTSVDLSKNTKLQTLDISLCEMSRIDLSKNLALKTLTGKRTNLSSIDLSNHKSLTTVSLSENFYLNTFDFTNCTALKTIRANNNSYYYGTNGNMYLDGCKNLEELYLSFGHLKSLDVTGCPKLKVLDCSLIGLSELNLTKNVNLTKLICSVNKLSELNLTKNTKLTYLDCSENYIDSLNLTKNTAITEVYCQKNYLTALNVSKNTKLKFLNCSMNDISTLNVTSNPNLVYLSCFDNVLSTLNVTKNLKLEILSCYSNDIAKLNITKNRSVALAVKSAKRQDAGSYYFHQLDGNGVYGLYGLYYDKDTVIVTPSKLPTPTKKASTPTPTKKAPTKTPSKGPTKAPTKAPQFSDFVERLYTCALNRKSEPEGKKYWTNEVQSGKRTGADCARYFLLEAPEFMKRGLSVEDFVETLYKTFFDRKSDAAGKKGWVSAIKSGKKTRAEVVNDFIESTEWCNICAKYSVKSGAKYHKATIASPKSKVFATRLYTSCLKRKADADGVKYWSLALTNLEQTGCSAAKFFFTGKEFVGLKTTPEEYVRRLYTTFMGRSASADEVKYWASQIKSGAKTRLDVLKFFGSSEEFTKICAKYGIDRGTI